MNTSGRDSFSTSILNDARYGYVEDPRLSEVDKDAIIISMQDKIDRLREKLNAVIENAQDIMLEAQNEQEVLAKQHAQEVESLQKANAELKAENEKLQAKAAQAQMELLTEREQFKALIRFVDRLKRRGREYVEIQKKANMIVTSTANLNMSTINQPGNMYQHSHHHGK